METCCFCGDYTGNAGKGEDSNYFEHIGPLCWECYRTIRDAATKEIERLRQQLAAADESARLQASTSDEQIERLRADLEICRGIPCYSGPDGEPGPPDIGAYLDAVKERDAARQAARELYEWGSDLMEYECDLGYKTRWPWLQEEGEGDE